MFQVLVNCSALELFDCWMNVPEHCGISLEHHVVAVVAGSFGEGWHAEVHDPEEDAKGEDVSLDTSVGLVVSLILYLWSHVHFCSTTLLHILIDRGDHSEVTELQLAVSTDEHVFEFDVEVGQTSLCMKGVRSATNLQEEVLELLVIQCWATLAYKVEKVAMHALFKCHNRLISTRIEALPPLSKVIIVVCGDIAWDVDCDIALGEAVKLDYVRVAYELLMNRDLSHHILPEAPIVKDFQGEVFRWK